MAIVFDQTQNDSFLLILDGKNFNELAACKSSSQVIPKGLHGHYFKD